jgi:DNA repair exonuclease SbcCD ATPase subunit
MDIDKTKKRIKDRLFHTIELQSESSIQMDDTASPAFDTSLRKKIKKTLEHIPIAGPVIIWLWRILNLPHWFYRLSRHFEGVVEQVDTLIHRQTEQDKEVDQLLNTLNSFKEEYDSIIHNIHTKLDSFSDQLHAITNNQKEYENNIDQLHKALSSFKDEYKKNINKLHNILQSITETFQVEDYIILDAEPVLGNFRKSLSDNRDEFYFAFENIFRGTETEIENFIYPLYLRR